jgi:hypothetical protein
VIFSGVLEYLEGWFGGLKAKWISCVNVLWIIGLGDFWVLVSGWKLLGLLMKFWIVVDGWFDDVLLSLVGGTWLRMGSG